MNLDRVKMEILSAATEDWTALWELVSDCRKIMPKTTNEELRVIVREAILTLVTEGLIDLCDRPFPRDAPIEPYAVTDAKRILSDAKNWDWPPTGKEYGIAATDLGMDSYFGSREAWDRR